MPTADEIIEFNANNKKKGWCRLGFPFWFLDNSLFQSILKESFRLSVQLFIRSDSVVYSFFSAKKRGYDIIIDWVETPVAANLSRAERELKNDPFSTFFSSISESGREKLSFFCRSRNVFVTDLFPHSRRSSISVTTASGGLKDLTCEF